MWGELVKQTNVLLQITKEWNKVETKFCHFFKKKKKKERKVRTESLGVVTIVTPQSLSGRQIVQCPVAATRKHCFAHYFIFTVGFFFNSITGQIQIFCTLFFKLRGSVNWTDCRRQSHSVAQSGGWSGNSSILFPSAKTSRVHSCCPDTGKQAVKLCTKVKSFWREYVIRLVFSLVLLL